MRAPRPTPRRVAQPEPAPRPHLRVVPPPSRSARRASLRRGRTGVVLGVAMALVFGSLMASALFHGLLVSGQSNLDRMDTQIQEERTALAQEKLELANLQSPERIAAEAAKLGMVPADQQHWVTPGTDDPPVVTGGDTTDSTDSSATSSDELAAADPGGSAQ